MDAGSYLHWLRTTDLDSARHSDLLEAVNIVIEALKEELASEHCEPSDDDGGGSEMLDCLEEIAEILAHGGLPLAEISAFRLDFFEPEAVQPAEVILEQELREIASGIARERWSTESYQKLRAAIEGYLDGGQEEELWRVVDDLESLIEESEAAYRNTKILPKEVTSESVVAHKILLEGIAYWRGALDLFRHGDCDSEPDWHGVLELAELGNRLLVTVEIFNDRLQRAVARS